MRADQLLVQRHLAPSRSAAQRLIARGAVRWLGPAGWAVPRKAGEQLPDDAALELTDDAELRYVSRGGLKLEGALARCAVDVRGLHVLDVGQSTGGFTDALLQHGAARVTGIDVGHGQLHPRLAADARVRCVEGVNARELDLSSKRRAAPGLLDPRGGRAGRSPALGAPSTLGDDAPAGGYPLIVGDLSFISLTLVLPALVRCLAPGGELLLLVKPQFELQPAQIGKGGIVRDAASYPAVEALIRAACAALDLRVIDYFESAVAGGDGNTEFFVRARRAHGIPTQEAT